MEQDSITYITIDGIGGGRHPAVDGQCLSEVKMAGNVVEMGGFIGFFQQQSKQPAGPLPPTPYQPPPPTTPHPPPQPPVSHS